MRDARPVGLAAATVAALAACMSATSSTAGNPHWAIVASGNSVPSLLAVSALADNEVWAVGSTGSGNAARPAVTFWDGNSLHVLPALSATVHGSLTGISAISSDDVWAVGTQTLDALWKTRPLAIHWDGQHWTVTPLPALPAESDLRDVKAFAAADDVWAVGNAGADRALVLHFDGSLWHRVDTANVAPAGTNLSAIDGRTPSDIWAVGGSNLNGTTFGWSDLILHWDGHQWTNTPSRIDGRTPSDIWAVGGSNLNGTTFGWSDLILHWDGHQWTNTPSRFDDTTGITANSVDTTPWGAVWTLHADNSGTYNQKIVRWNGWTRRPVTVYFWTPQIENDFNAIAAITRRDAWIVGQRCPDSICRPLLMHWNGKTWQILHTPLDQAHSDGLYDLSTLPSGHLWAAGDRLLVRYG